MMDPNCRIGLVRLKIPVKKWRRMHAGKQQIYWRESCGLRVEGLHWEPEIVYPEDYQFYRPDWVDRVFALIFFGTLIGAFIWFISRGL